MVKLKAKRKQPAIHDKAIDGAIRKYPGHTSYESVQRTAYASGYLAGWRAAKREKRR